MTNSPNQCNLRKRYWISVWKSKVGDNRSLLRGVCVHLALDYFLLILNCSTLDETHEEFQKGELFNLYNDYDTKCI